jgi:hypothetical protein
MLTGSGSPWTEHTAGPVIRGAQLCSRCGEVLTAGGRTPYPDGTRVASDGAGHARSVTGWPYTPCEPWNPAPGERPRPAAVHRPGCNGRCSGQGHFLLPAGAQGEPFSHQEDGPPAPAGDDHGAGAPC